MVNRGLVKRLAGVAALCAIGASSAAAHSQPKLGALVWKATGGAPDTQFGNAVGTAGDVNGDGFDDLLVGAQYFDGDLINEGRSACYLGGPDGLATTPHWLVEGDVESGEFGYSVATAGDVNGDGISDVVVGARRMGDSHPGEGFVFLYLGSPAGLSAYPSQFFDSNEYVAFLGCSVSAAGDVDADGFCDVIAGARLFDLLATDGGAAFLYRGGAAGASATNWSAGIAQHGALFGYSVSGAGDLDADGFADVIIGAYEANDGQPSEGRLFAYHGGPGGLNDVAAWIGDLDHDFAHLGFSVRVAGDVNGDGYSDVIAGAPDFSGTFVRQGAAFLFTGSNSGLGPIPAWSAFGRSAEAGFGHAVSTAGDVDADGYADLVVGSPRFDVSINGDEGSIELYFGSPAGPSVEPDLRIDGAELYAQFGYHVAHAGDVDGDGRGEFAVGSPTSAAFGFDEGSACVFAGASDDLADADSADIAGSQAGEGFAASLASLSDVDGDGFSEVAAGSPAFDATGAPDAGRVVVHRGAPAGFAAAPAFERVGGLAGAREGRIVVGPGDVDGDGHADLLVAGAVGNGVSLFLGAPASLGLFAPDPDVSLVPGASLAEVGSRAAALGDVNGDGFADFALRGERLSDGGHDVLVYLGSAGGPVGPAVTIPLPQGAGEVEIAGAGDLDLDGRDDLLVSAPLGAGGKGEVFALRSIAGAAGALEFVPWGTATGAAIGDGFGVVVRGAHDLDGDGASDFAVGSPASDVAFTDAGRIDVYLGPGAGAATIPTRTLLGSGPNVRFGVAIEAAGDVDADGRCDLLVASLGANSAGAVELFLGEDGGVTGASVFRRDGLAADDRLGAALAGGFDAGGDGFSDVAIAAPGADSGVPDGGAVYVHAGGGGYGRPAAARLTRAASPSPIAPHGFTTTANVGFELASAGAFGRGRVRVEWQVAPEGVPFSSGAATKGGVGEIVDSAAEPVARADSAALWTGRVHHRFRLRHDPASLPFASHGPWFSLPDASVREATLRVAPTPSLLAVTAKDPFVLAAFSGGSVVSGEISVANLGGELLSWTVTELVDQPWLEVSPTSGSGLLASSGATVVAVHADPKFLGPGPYSATLRFVDLAAPGAPHDVTVQLAVTSVSFVPGDRIEAALGPIGDHAFGEFEGVEGMKLKLALIEGTAIGSRYRVSLFDAAGLAIGSKILSPADKPKGTFSLTGSGAHRIRVERLGGPPSNAAFSTQRILPPEAASFAKTVKKGAAEQKTLRFVVLAGTELDLQLAPNSAFGGPLAATLVLPDAAELSIAALGEPFGDGGLRLTKFAFAESGACELRFLDFAGSKKEKVKAKATLAPPPPGSSVVVLKATPAR